MSHNIALKDVRFKDMSMLGQVIADLSGGQATLDLMAKTFRTYAGQPNKCDAAIKMPGKHDIGLQRQMDGSHIPVFDPYNMTPIFRAEGGSNYVGALAREYAMREAEYEAAQQGYTTQRVEGEKGVITLEIIAG